MTQRRFTKVIACLAAMLFLAALLVPHFQTPSARDIEIVELLNHPRVVVDWDEDGLWLDDGSQIALPDVDALPLSSLALEEATKRGVEVTPDGRVFGLVKIHHWCGNSSIR